MDRFINKPKIFIAIAKGDNMAVTGLETDLLFWTHNPRYIVKVYPIPYRYPLDNARNFGVKEFLQTDCDYLWWIDNDIVPPKETLHRLVQADKDVIGAVGFSTKYDEVGQWFVYPVTLRYNKDMRYVVFYDGNGITEVDAIGGACVIVKRKVYEMIERPYQFHYHRDGTMSLTADFDFCQKVQKAGFKIYVDFGLQCSHFKTVDLKQVNRLLVKNGR